MRKNVLVGAGLLIGLILLVAVFQAFPINELLLLLISIQPGALLLYLSVSVIIFLLLSYRWQIILKQHGHHIPFHRLFGYKTIGFAVSFITPGPRVGGEPARAAMLAREDISFPEALSTAIADKTIELVSFGVMFVISLIAALATLELAPTWRAILALITFTIAFLVLYGFTQILQGKDPVLKLFKLLRLHRIPWLRKYETELEEFEKSIHGFYGTDRERFWQAVLVSGVAWSLGILEFYALLTMLGFAPTFVQVFLVYSVVGVVYLMPVPLALGVLEAAQASLMAGIGMTAAGGAAVALITRGRDLLWTLIGFAYLSHHGIGTLRRNENA